MGLLLAILLSVTLQPPFGEAEATALKATGILTIDFSVEVEGEPTAVLVRMVGLAGELPTLALVDRGGGTWGNIARLTGLEDIQVSFEYIEADGTSTISQSSRLTALGVDPAVIAPGVPTKPPPEPAGIDPWLVAALAAGLAAVVLLMWWANGGFADTVTASDWTYAESVGAEPATGEDSGAEEPSSVDDD
jgi:hypothetical protein